MTLEPATIAKYLAGAALIGSVFYLVLVDKATTELYVALVTGGLAALGVNASGGSKP